MYQLIKRKEINLTPVSAASILETNEYEQQRVLRPARVAMLRRCMQDGTFLTGYIALAKCLYNGGKTVLLNGQHQCNAVLQEGKNIPAIHEMYLCESPEDTALLYRQFDNTPSRSLNDIARPEAAAFGIEWPLQVVGLVISAATILEKAKHLSKNEKLGLLKPYRVAGAFVANILSPDNVLHRSVKHLTRAAVIASMIITWRKNPQDAFYFWTKIRDGEILKKNMPEYKLREYLTHCNLSTPRSYSIKSSGNVVTTHEIMSKCITAWNAYRKKTSTDLKYYMDKPIPRAI